MYCIILTVTTAKWDKTLADQKPSLFYRPSAPGLRDQLTTVQATSLTVLIVNYAKLIWYIFALTKWKSSIYSIIQQSLITTSLLALEKPVQEKLEKKLAIVSCFTSCSWYTRKTKSLLKEWCISWQSSLMSCQTVISECPTNHWYGLTHWVIWELLPYLK